MQTVVKFVDDVSLAGLGELNFEKVEKAGGAVGFLGYFEQGGILEIVLELDGVGLVSFAPFHFNDGFHVFNSGAESL